MWPQKYTPVGNDLAFPALVAAIPIFVPLFLIGIRRKSAWIASLAGLAGAVAATMLVAPGFTLKHSIFLTLVIGMVVMFYAYVAPQWAP